jgi:Skp family chaperone for outer membrane proteins
MHYELVSRALAYVSCLATLSLFATSMAIAAVNVGRLPTSACPGPSCVAAQLKSMDKQFGGLVNRAHVEAVAQVLWSRKI